MLTSDTSAASRPEYAGSVLVAAPMITEYAMSPSFSASPTPVTVMVRTTFQLAGVNVIDARDTVPSVASLDTRLITTFDDGAVFRTMPNVTAPPDSVVVVPDAGRTTTSGDP